MKRSSKVTLIAGLVIALTAGIALAAWLVSGNGSGSAKAGSLTAITVHAATPTADLYPGGAGKLYLNVGNPNAFDLKITGVSRTSGAIVSDAQGCDASSVTFADQTGLNVSLAGNANNFTFSVDGVTMAAGAATECQGATFTIPVKVDAQTP